MAKIGFARVSSDEQDLLEQLDLLIHAGCEKIFHGNQSGLPNENEEKFDALIEYIRENDIVITKSLDKLGRSLKTILTSIQQIHAKNVTLRTIDGVLDTSIDSPLNEALVYLLGTFSKLERDLLSERTKDGREIAKAKGKHMGRPFSLSPKTRETILLKLRNGESISELSRQYKVSRPTITRIRNEDINRG
ncbi:recombinase family protein [Alishewanella longhuensis]